MVATLEAAAAVGSGSDRGKGGGTSVHPTGQSMTDSVVIRESHARPIMSRSGRTLSRQFMPFGGKTDATPAKGPGITGRQTLRQTGVGLTDAPEKGEHRLPLGLLKGGTLGRVEG